jgi:hypothetical protein
MGPNNDQPFMTPPGQPGPQGVSRRVLALMIAGGVVIIIIIVVLLLNSGNKNKNNPTTGSSHSPSPSASASASPSGSPSPTPTPIPTPTPTDQAKAPTPQPTFNNFDALTTEGFTSGCMDDLKYALGKYAQQIGKPDSTIDLDPNSISSSTTPGVTGIRYSFSLNYEGTATYNATAYLSTPTAGSFQLISSKNGSTVYDSGTIDLSNGTGD